MSTLAGPRVRPVDAFGSQITDLVRAAWVRLPAESKSPRDLAFSAYRREVRRIMRADTMPFEVVGRRIVASSERSSVIELELTTRARMNIGDMLYVWWRNDPARLETLDEAFTEATVGHWSTPVPHRPSRRSQATIAQLLESVFDLSAFDDGLLADLDSRGLQRLPRITPRLYTASEVRAAADGRHSIVRLQVTMRSNWPQRAAAFLHRLAPGDRMRAWVMPHPHRVDRTGPGVAVATGSGAAGVFAALRSGATGIDLVWGLGDKSAEPWVVEELQGHERSGALASLRIVNSPLHVEAALLEAPGLPERFGRGEWLYVSGNEAASRSSYGALVELLGEDALRTASSDLRYISSS